MIISVVLNTEYMDVAERNKWFLKNVSNAMIEDTLIITHSYFQDNLEDVIENCSERFYTEFEMERVPVDRVKELDICYIPDEWLDSVYEACGSRTKQIICLSQERNEDIENYIISFVDKALEKRKQTKPDYILNSLYTFASIKFIAQYYDCPIIPYVFSAIRKVHGYSQTLYMAHIDDNLFNSNACLQMYEARESIGNSWENNENNSDKNDFDFPILSKREILALLGKKHNMPLLPLLDRTGKYDVGVIGEGFHISPCSYALDSVTDDDIYFESKRFFNSIITRQHPIQMDQIGLGRKHLKNDPVAFLLNCNRVVTVMSQMIIKAAIWNRAAITMSTALPYSCLLNNKVNDAHAIDDYKLNFILFAYFVPNSCMFSSEYWKWRMTKPSVMEIVHRNMKAILNALNIPENIISCKEERIEKILKYRGFSENEIQKFLTVNTMTTVNNDNDNVDNIDNIENVPLEIPSSCIKCHLSSGEIKSIYSLNHKIDGSIVTEADIPENTVKLEFIPQNDIDGCVSINSLTIDNKETIYNLRDKYFAKNETVITIPIEQGEQSKKMKVKWSINPYDFDRGGGTLLLIILAHLNILCLYFTWHLYNMQRNKVR